VYSATIFGLKKAGRTDLVFLFLTSPFGFCFHVEPPCHGEVERGKIKEEGNLPLT
jgi:hypothetical protein